jgi:hypothetical protein
MPKSALKSQSYSQELLQGQYNVLTFGSIEKISVNIFTQIQRLFVQSSFDILEKHTTILQYLYT